MATGEDRTLGHAIDCRHATGELAAVVRATGRGSTEVLVNLDLLALLWPLFLSGPCVPALALEVQSGWAMRG